MVGMSRYIWCSACTDRFDAARGTFEAENDDATELTTLRFGLVAYRELLCDFCNQLLPVGTLATAVSMYEKPEDYVPWERGYLTVAEDYPQKGERPPTASNQEDADGRSGEPTPSKDATHDKAWPMISMYTRSQAMADGVLFDVTPVAREAGFLYPVAVSCGVWVECIAVPPGVECQDEGGRLWDVLTMLALAAFTSGPKPKSEIRYQLHVRNDNRDIEPPLVDLVAVCGPDDDGSPCVTVMLPGED